MILHAQIGGNIITIDDGERQECEIWSRVMGYYRPVSEYNIGKRAEHEERVFFKEKFAERIINE